MDPNIVINLLAFIVLALLWLLFGCALFFQRAWLQRAWQAFRGWPILAQAGVGLLTLPVVAGLWVWQTRWPGWLRLALVAGLAWVTLYTFFPASVLS